MVLLVQRILLLSEFFIVSVANGVISTAKLHYGTPIARNEYSELIALTNSFSSNIRCTTHQFA
jgi:hypothetical protein